MLTEVEHLLLSTLISTREGPKDPDKGICDHIYNELRDLYRTPEDIHMEWGRVILVMGVLFRAWPEYSGRPGFPIGKRGDFEDNIGKMWSKQTDYGRARWRLLHWMIDQLEKEQDHA